METTVIIISFKLRGKIETIQQPLNYSAPIIATQKTRYMYLGWWVWRGRFSGRARNWAFVGEIAFLLLVIVKSRKLCSTKSNG